MAFDYTVIQGNMSSLSSLIIYGKPKCGKSTILSKLDDCLCVDMEGNGYECLTALKRDGSTYEKLAAILKELNDEKAKLGHNPIKRIALDHISLAEEILLPKSAAMYRSTPMGKAWLGSDVRQLPNGAGWYFIRETIMQLIDAFKKVCDTLIIVGHTKDKMINVNSEDLTEMTLDLPGKLSEIVVGNTPNVGYIYRKDGQTIISFKGGDNVIKGSRSEHLRNRDIIVGESDENGKVITHWELIFPELKK
jgi:hypothetical protein